MDGVRRKNYAAFNATREWRLSDALEQKFMNRLFDHGLSDFELFMPIDEIKCRVVEIDQDSLTEPHKKLYNVFMELYSEHDQNKGKFPAAHETPPKVDPPVSSTGQAR